MARKKSTVASDLIVLVSKLPPLVGAVMAVALYVGLHALATSPMPVPVVVPGRQVPTGDLLLPAMGRGAAVVLQYVLPVLCLAGAAVSFAGRRKSKSLFDAVPI
jgi:restriction system protein